VGCDPGKVTSYHCTPRNTTARTKLDQQDLTVYYPLLPTATRSLPLTNRGQLLWASERERKEEWTKETFIIIVPHCASPDSSMANLRNRHNYLSKVLPANIIKEILKQNLKKVTFLSRYRSASLDFRFIRRIIQIAW